MTERTASRTASAGGVGAPKSRAFVPARGAAGVARWVIVCLLRAALPALMFHFVFRVLFFVFHVYLFELIFDMGVLLFDILFCL